MNHSGHGYLRRAAWIFVIALPVLLCAGPLRAAESVVERLNRDRAAEDLPRLVPDPRLDAVASDLAAAVTRAGSADAVDLDSQVVTQRLRDRGYSPRRLVIGYVVGAYEEQIAAQWPALDPETWRRMLEAQLRNVALARGETAQGPFFLLLAAVSQNDAKEADAAALSDLAAVRQRVLELTNEVRSGRRLRRLKADPGADRVAQAYAEDMLRRGFYGHISPEGDDVMDRLQRGRVFAGRAGEVAAGENLAEGPPTPEAAVKGWYDSPGHRDNLLHEAFRSMGLGVAAGEDPDGVYKIYWVQVFTSAPGGR